MPLSLDDAMKTSAAPVQSRGMSLDDAYKSMPPPAAASPSAIAGAGQTVLTGAKAAAGKYYTDYVKLANDYKDSLKEDARADPKGFGPQLLQGGKTLMDLMGSAFSPLESAARTGIIQPVGEMVDRVSGLVQDHMAADDQYDAQARRMGQRGQQYPKGVDWKVHKQDVSQAAEGLNKFIETGVLAAVGMVGGKEMPAGEVVEHPTGAKTEELAAKAGKVDEKVPPKPDPTSEPKVEEIKAPEFKTVGTDALTGKPRVRQVSPEAAAAEVSNATMSVHEDIHPDAPKGWDTVPGGKEGTSRDSIPGKRTGLYGEIEALHGNMMNHYIQARASGEPVEARQMLGTMIEGTPNGYVKGLLTKLGTVLEDMPVHFVDKIGANQQRLGEYRFDPNTNKSSILIQYRPEEPGMTKTVIHEMVHGATSQFIFMHPEHELVKSLEFLRKEAVYRTGKSGGLRHYGLENTHEFVAEAMSNPGFQRFLANSSKHASPKWDKVRTIWDRFAATVAKMFGVNSPEESKLLHNAMSLSKTVMDTQYKESFGHIVGMENGRPLTAGELDVRGRISRLPGVAESTGRLAGYLDEFIRMFNPEGLGERAKIAAAVVASRVAERVQRTAAWNHGAKTRLSFWESNKGITNQFIESFELGARFKNPELQKMAQWYREWNNQIFRQDKEFTGLKYDPRDNYLAHIFEDQEGVTQYFQQKYGKKWGDPGFIKDRSFNLYSEAVKAGFKPKFSNPEEIMLARQLSSDIANMQQSILKDLEHYGVATEKQKGSKDVPDDTSLRRAPNGQWYHVDNTAYAILHNAFDTKSLWATKGIVGDTFRGAMALKNSIVPLRLAISGFHPLHVIHIDNAAMTAMAWKNVLGGTGSVVKAFGETVKNLGLYQSFWKNPKAGSRLIKVWRGDIPKSQLSEADATALQYMTEGGFIPQMSDVYRTNAVQSFKKAIRDHSAKALWHAPWALLSTLQKPLFEIWIPNLKAASYMRETANALKNNPALHDDNLGRQLALRKVAKSIDNRYGEMAYDTLFWTRWAKDLAVANTLSLGWQMGFIREYGGGALDLGQFARAGDKSRVQRIREGMLDRPAFVSAYTLTALGYGGLLTWGLTGKAPSELMDYVMPRSGNQNPDGTPQRLNTMFYTREFASIYKHMQNEGIVAGLGHLVANKSSGLIGLIGQSWTGVNAFGQETRDPDGPIFKKIEQQLAYTMLDLEPISTRSIEINTNEPWYEKVADTAKGAVMTKEGRLSMLGFNPAPKYMGETKAQAHITQAYGLYVAPKQTPYDRVQSKGEANGLRAAYKSDDPEFGDKFDKFADDHKLDNSDKNKLLKSFKRDEGADIYMFSRIPWEEQVHLLDAMTPEEREQYLPHANKKHVRKSYVPPEEREAGE